MRWLPEIAPPKLPALPDALAEIEFGAADGGLGVFIDLVRDAGRPGAVPAVALAYSTGAGNGPFGCGWSVGVPSVGRGTGRRLPRYRDAGPDADGFSMSDHGELVPTLHRAGGSWAPVVRGEDGERVCGYRPRLDGDVVRGQNPPRRTGSRTRQPHH